MVVLCVLLFASLLTMSIKGMLLLMRAVQQADHNRFSRIRLQYGSGGIAIAEGAEDVGGVFATFQPLDHGLTAVIDPHHARVVIGARMLRRVERSSATVEKQGKVVNEQGKFPVRFPIR